MARSNRVALASALLGLVALLGAASAFPIPKKNGIQVPVEGGLVATGGPRLPKKCDVAIVGAGPGASLRRCGPIDHTTTTCLSLEPRHACALTTATLSPLFRWRLRRLSPHS